jgi:hypothetical protein
MAGTGTGTGTGTVNGDPAQALKLSAIAGAKPPAKQESYWHVPSAPGPQGTQALRGMSGHGYRIRVGDERRCQPGARRTGARPGVLGVIPSLPSFAPIGT